MKSKHLVFSALCAGALSCALPAQASVEHLMPPVKELTQSSGTFAPGQVTVTDPTATPLLKTYLQEIGCTEGSGKTVNVSIVESIPGAFNHNIAAYPDEAYILSVTPQAINIRALTQTGVIRAAQTLKQLALQADGTYGAIECVEITDWPAFKVRGLMHDVGRSFLSMEELKREIDLLSQFKVNTFHWHLTDYTGWRLEIKKYPNLVGHSSYRFSDKFYTQEDAKELQQYAAERGMIIIPEIDMPGHAHPFETVMGFNMQDSRADEVLHNILDEVVEVFNQAPYIHIGGDEVSFNDDFLLEKVNYLHDKGKKVVIWNRYNSPAKPVNFSTMPVDMTTNWATAGALSTGGPNIDMRYNYTNHFDVFADLVGIYKSTIFNVAQGNDDVAGTISAAWCDTMTDTEDDIVRQNNVYANVLASGERAWKGGGKQYIETGGAFLPLSGEEFDEFADWERRFIFHKNTTLATAKHQIPYVAQCQARWRIMDQMPNQGSSDAVLGPEAVMNLTDILPWSYTVGDKVYNSNVYAGSGFYLRHIWHGTVKGIFANPQDGMTSYAWTYLNSEEEQDVDAYIEFYTYSRSGAEKAPQAGKWDRRGSRIWVNDTEIPAPTWTQPNANIPQNSTNQGLKNENFTARPPVKIHLKKGLNRVFAKLPHVNKGGTSRDKWQFTFALADPETGEAPTNISYVTDEQSAKADLIGRIASARASVANLIGPFPGHYQSSEFDRALLAKADSIENVVAQNPDLTDPQVAELAEEMTAAVNAFSTNYKNAGLTPPENPDAYYYIQAPNIGNRVVNELENGNLTGATTPSHSCGWKIQLRADGTFNFINYVSGHYISTKVNGKILTTSATEPATGWEILPSADSGKYIIVNGSNQINQTNNDSNGYNIFNWGGGTNTTDNGCKFQFVITDYEDSGNILPTIEAARNSMSEKLGGFPGYYQTGEHALSLQAKIANIEQQLEAGNLTNAQKKQLGAELEELLQAFNANYKSAGLTPPADTAVYYNFKSKRGNRYVTETEAGVLNGATAAGNASAWRIVPREDGAFDLVNYVSKHYIQNTAGNNTALTTSTVPSATGWEILPSSLDTHFIIVNGEAQFNQTNNSGQGFNVFNWGYSVETGLYNLTDDGCCYELIATSLREPEESNAIATVQGDGVTITALPGAIAVAPATARIEVFDLRGSLIAASSGVVKVAPGLYLVRAEGKVEKILVK